MRYHPLPADLPTAFRSKDAYADGLSYERLRANGVRVLTNGVMITGPIVDAAEKARAIDLVLSGTYAFSHRTAGRLWGMALPWPWTPEERVDVTRRTEDGWMTRRHVRWHTGLEHHEVVHLQGLPVTTPGWTLLDLATEQGMRVPELVAAGDVLLNRADLASGVRAELARLVGLRRRRGVRLLREAVALMRPGSASPMESITRARFVLAGAPEPEINADVVQAGVWLGRVDLLWREARVIVEYEGDQHRADRAQWQHDITRVRRLEAAGYLVLRVTVRDLADPRAFAELVARLLDLTQP